MPARSVSRKHVSVVFAEEFDVSGVWRYSLTSGHHRHVPEHTNQNILPSDRVRVDSFFVSFQVVLHVLDNSVFENASRGLT